MGGERWSFGYMTEITIVRVRDEGLNTKGTVKQSENKAVF